VTESNPLAGSLLTALRNVGEVGLQLPMQAHTVLTSVGNFTWAHVGPVLHLQSICARHHGKSVSAGKATSTSAALHAAWHAQEANMTRSATDNWNAGFLLNMRAVTSEGDEELAGEDDFDPEPPVRAEVVVQLVVSLAEVVGAEG